MILEEDWDNVLKVGLCIPAILVEYAKYALASADKHVPDEQINELFKKIDTVIHRINDEDGKPLTTKSKYCSHDPTINPNVDEAEPENLGNVYNDVCPILEALEKAKSRLDKVIVIEHAISTFHDRDLILNWAAGCDAKILPQEVRESYVNYEGELAEILLDLLFER